MAKIKISEQQARLLGLKPNLKLKITKEQYNRIFASGLIKENNLVSGGLNRVDKTFKKEFGGPIKEGDSLSNEVLDLIKFMYRKEENLSPFWSQKGLTYDKICDELEAKNMIVKKDGKCTVSKSLGDAKTAIKMIEDALKEMVGVDDITEIDNYPAGAEFDKTAPFNQNEPEVTNPKTSSNKQLEMVGMGREIAILKGADGLYAFYHYDLGEGELADYTSLEKFALGKDEDGEVEYEYGDFEKTDSAIENYINDNIDKLSIGLGLKAYEAGADLVKIDDELKDNLLSLYDKDTDLVKALSSMNENTESPDDRMARLMAAIELKRAESERLEKQRQDRLDKQNAIDSAKAEEKMKIQQMMAANEPEEPKGPENFFGTPWDQVEETTTAASSGAFTSPMSSPIKKELPVSTNDLDVPVVYENNDNNYTHFAINKDDNKIVNGWDYSNLYDSDSKSYDNESIKEYSKLDLIDMFPDKKPSEFKIVTNNFLKKNNINPSDVNNWYNVATIYEVTTAGSAGNLQYDANALPGINRDGSFKKTPKTKAETKTQWAGGAMVDFNDCTKLNNKSTSTGCSQGAVDKVVKYKKTKGNINAPSLSESKNKLKQ